MKRSYILFSVVLVCSGLNVFAEVQSEGNNSKKSKGVMPLVNSVIYGALTGFVTGFVTKMVGNTYVKYKQGEEWTDYKELVKKGSVLTITGVTAFGVEKTIDDETTPHSSEVYWSVVVLSGLLGCVVGDILVKPATKITS
jgi:hypothetical protein